MKITLDRVLGLLGVIFAIPALLELVRPEGTREGILLSALAVLIFGYLIYRRCEEKQPLFTYLAISKELTFGMLGLLVRYSVRPQLVVHRELTK